LKIGNTSLGIGHANRAHAACSAADAHTRFFWCLADFLFHTLCTKGIDFFEGALMCDEFSTQFPRGATLFELLGVLVYHQEMLHALSALFGKRNRLALEAWGVGGAEKGHRQAWRTASPSTARCRSWQHRTASAQRWRAASQPRGCLKARMLGKCPWPLR